jgi:hypothetical protein
MRGIGEDEKMPKSIPLGYVYLTHKFFDKDIEYAMIGPETIELGIDEDQSAILLNKSDVEALARHFKIIHL